MGKKETKKDKGAAAEDWRAKLAQGFGRDTGPKKLLSSKNLYMETTKIMLPVITGRSITEMEISMHR